MDKDDEHFTGQEYNGYLNCIDENMDENIFTFSVTIKKECDDG